MKKLITIVLALAMILAIAAPAFAEGTVGWDVIASEAEAEKTYKDFDLTVTRLEYEAASRATVYGWNENYYVEYDPANKGVVVGTPVRFIVNLTVPAEKDIKDFQQIEKDNEGIDFTVTPANFTIKTVESQYKVNKTGAVWTKNAYHLIGNVSSKGVYEDKLAMDDDYSISYYFMFTGVVNTTADATATAKISFGMTSFDDDGIYYFAVGATEYKVQHVENYFYVENNSDKLDYVVRFTVDANNKITNIAVNDGDEHDATYMDVKLFDADTAAEAAIEKKDHMKAIDKANLQTMFKLYKAEIDSQITVNHKVEALLDDIYDDLATGYTYKNFNTNSSDAAVVMAINRTITEYTNSDGEVVYDGVKKFGVDGAAAKAIAISNANKTKFTEYPTYVRIATPATFSYENGSSATPEYIMTFKDTYSYGYLVEKSTQHNDHFYTATKVVDSSAYIFSLDQNYYNAGYVALANGAAYTNGAKVDFTETEDPAAHDPDPNFATYMAGEDKAVLAMSVTDNKDVLTSGATYNKYAAALNEILAVLNYVWDGNTKYMQEQHFLNMFSNAYAKTATATWYGYTATLIVDPTVEPPQTGDASSIIGFVMLAMAIAAAAVVTIKKVRA